MTTKSTRLARSVREGKQQRMLHLAVASLESGGAPQLGDGGAKVMLRHPQKAERVVKRRHLRRPLQRIPEDTLAHVVTTLSPI
jgi:hypothetical protein